MKPKLGTSVTALFIATLTLRSTVIVAAVSYHHERTINSTEMPTQSIRAFNSPLLKRPFSVAAYPPFSFRHTNPRGDSKMRKTLFASMLAAGLVLPAFAEDAGTIKLHSGWKLIQERVDKGVAYGTLWGSPSTMLAAVLCTWHLLLGPIVLHKRPVRVRASSLGAKVMTNSRGRLAYGYRW
jgi:hypothetical protein